ncbi:hypothetical protein MNBD_GAMMA01-905 [hydrothermal vent metagenome]|uniref:EF-hand domain-containing protein n=1 Tax=hydrothermal vent metagenome TaxID=652676 RepID=A0A3B0V675_9ZZZZ
MSGILDMITQQMGSSMMQQMATKIGGDSDGVKRAAATAVPMILAALKRNSNSRQGAESLAGALDKNYSDGGLLGNLGGLLGGSSMQNGGKILGHVFGSKQNNMAQQLGKATGIGGKGAGDLMAMLAPMVMGALGKAKTQGNLGVGGLQAMLASEQQSIQKRQPKQLGMIKSLLDSDGDGDVDLTDILKQGSGLLSGFFKR